MMVSFEDVPLKPSGKWKRKKAKYEAVGGDDSSQDEEDTLYSSDGYISVDTDGDEEDLKRREYKYRRARWFVCYGWKWWCQRYFKNTYNINCIKH
jgi:hypothetical protein